MLENAKLYDKDFDATANRSWAATTVIDGKTYVAGLFWQPLQNRDDPYTEIDETAESILEGADLFALKPGKVVQFGVCSSSDGYRKGMNSLAVSVATSFADKSSFVAVFKVDNGWWYCCVRNDIILSDGDMLFLKEEDAKEQFMSMMTVPDWGYRIAPAEWGIEDTKAMDLSAILENGIRAKLQKVKALRGIKLYAIVAVSAVIGFWVLSSFVVDVLFAPKKQPVIVAPVRPKIIKPVVVEEKPIIKPWETLKNPEEILLYCYRDAMNMVKIMPPGWKIGGINCSDSGATVSWNRQVGRISWVDQALNESGMKFAARSISTDGGTLIASTSYSPQTIKSPPAYTDIELKNIINDLFQSLDLSISLSDQQETVQVPAANPNDPPKTIIYKQVGFSFTVNQNPMTWMDVLTKFSGLVINSIKYDTDSGSWSYEGVIYVL
ncbi:MAG: type 4b pilus protein PilO2 [Alphaproteobacteria bacterium]|nr:type 4b pilus protein PilO2 [Alphaproteobacteria bacterium]